VRIAHPHVLTPYSWAAEDAHVVIASELADGGSVTTLLGDWGALDPATVAVLLDQLLEALEHVHAAGLVHRDVKPANLLLRATGTAAPHLMLSDFGIAMGVDDAHLTQAGTVVGTPDYLAPELMRGGVTPDPRHDLYAAGRVAIALLGGEEPRDPAPRPVPIGPGPLRDLVAALAAEQPLYRPPSASVARSSLRPALPHHRSPHTAAGESVDVLGQLPPLSAAALAESGAAARGGAARGPDADRRADRTGDRRCPVDRGVGSRRHPSRATAAAPARAVRAARRRRRRRRCGGGCAGGAGAVRLRLPRPRTVDVDFEIRNVYPGADPVGGCRAVRGHLRLAARGRHRPDRERRVGGVYPQRR
jgi:eukaryotic-like serine/threonine-protein kinase